MGVIWSCVFSLLCSPNSKMDKVKHNRLESHSVFKVLFFLFVFIFCQPNLRELDLKGFFCCTQSFCQKGLPMLGPPVISCNLLRNPVAPPQRNEVLQIQPLGFCQNYGMLYFTNETILQSEKPLFALAHILGS